LNIGIEPNLQSRRDALFQAAFTITVISIQLPIEALGIGPSTTRLSAGFGQPALDFVVVTLGVEPSTADL